MKICYVTAYDARDARQWSGLGSFIARTLADHGAELDYCGPLENTRSLLAKAEQLYCQRVAKRTHVRGREPWQLRNYARQIRAHIAKAHPDVIFSPGTIPVSLLDTEKPIVFWTDATFTSLVNFYPGYSNLCLHTLRDGIRMEQSALDRSRLAVYSSEWAARSAIEEYGVSANKVHVVPFGANLESVPSLENVREAVLRRASDRCNLLFVSSDWARKGGDSVLKVAEALEQRGIATEVTIMGEQPPPGKNLPAGTRVVGFLDKNSAEGRTRIESEFLRAHFLLLPAVAECCAVVIAEANAFGVPCITSDVGGTSTALRNDVNGRMYPLEAYVEGATAYIAELFASHERYARLSENCRAEYEERLNWDVAGKQMRKLMDALC